MRNDLSKVCKTGSVNVDKLLAIETFPAVHHLVSPSRVSYPGDQHTVDWLCYCFPRPSIGGSPKIRAMQIIEELEPHRRSVYCGNIGYINFNGSMDANIAISTLLHKNDHLYYSAGAAIVADSNTQAEYQESLDKIQLILIKL